MGQVSKWGSIAVQAEGWDATPTTIKRKEAPPRKGRRKTRKVNNKTKNCTIEEHVVQRIISPWLN